MNNESEIPESNGTVVLSKYTMHLHAIQSPSRMWTFVIEFYPFDSNYQFQSTPFMVKAQCTFEEYEYALEAGLDVLETIGFDLIDKTIVDVYKLLEDGNYIKSLIEYDGDEFVILDEFPLSYEEFIEQFKEQE